MTILTIDDIKSLKNFEKSMNYGVGMVFIHRIDPTRCSYAIHQKITQIRDCEVIYESKIGQQIAINVHY